MKTATKTPANKTSSLERIKNLLALFADAARMAGGAGKSGRLEKIHFVMVRLRARVPRVEEELAFTAGLAMEHARRLADDAADLMSLARGEREIGLAEQICDAAFELVQQLAGRKRPAARHATADTVFNPKL